MLISVRKTNADNDVVFGGKKRQSLIVVDFFTPYHLPIEP